LNAFKNGLQIALPRLQNIQYFNVSIDYYKDFYYSEHENFLFINFKLNFALL